MPEITMPGITMPMGRYLREHPAQKYLFFGGKGGVGKTVFALSVRIPAEVLMRFLM